MTTRVEFAALLEELATKVIELPGVSRRNPHAFAEAKSDLAARMRRQARDFRAPASAPRSSVAFVSGTVLIGQRVVPVEVRRRPRAVAR